VNNLLTIIALIVMLASGYWMSSDKYISLGSISLSSNWGTVGLALGACFMIMSIKRRKIKNQGQ
jgi:heme/copper-type cytochrome/quinol oxidase subunit 3